MDEFKAKERSYSGQVQVRKPRLGTNPTVDGRNAAWGYIKPFKQLGINHHKPPTSTGEFTGLLDHQQVSESPFLYIPHPSTPRLGVEQKLLAGPDHEV